MAKRRKKGITKKGTGKGFNERPQEARKIGASTIYDWLAPRSSCPRSQKCHQSCNGVRRTPADPHRGRTFGTYIEDLRDERTPRNAH